MENKKITAIIPARGASKGVPRKNIADVGGYPLIAFSIAACKMCDRIEKIVVSTECDEIASIANSNGAEILKRPKEYSRDDSTDSEFLLHFFENYNDNDVALIRPTTPFRDPVYMSQVIQKYFVLKDQIDSTDNNKPWITGLRTVHEVNENPYKVCRISPLSLIYGFFQDYDGMKDYLNLPRQTFPKAYMGNGHIDIVKRETVNKKTTFGKKIHAEVCEKMIDIDCEFDLTIARLAVQYEEDLLSYLKENK